MTLNGVGSRTRLRLPAGEPRRQPGSRAHCCGPTERSEEPAAAERPGRPLGARDGRVRRDLRAPPPQPPKRVAALGMTPPAPLLLRLLLALSAAARVPGTAPPASTGDATLAIVFDVTGSMWDDLMQVMDGASRILERSLSRHSQAIANYALVPFHDPGSAPRRPVARRGAALTRRPRARARTPARRPAGAPPRAPRPGLAAAPPAPGTCSPRPGPRGPRWQASDQALRALRSDAVRPPPGRATSASRLAPPGLAGPVYETGCELPPKVAETLK